MSWETRDYNRPTYTGSYGAGEGGGGGRRVLGGWQGGKSVVSWLLIINLVVFVLDSILIGSRRASFLAPYEFGHFSIEKGLYGFQLWRVVTYQFLHGGLLHIFFNMLALYYFGPMLEHWWGRARFLAFYLICGVGSIALYTGLAYIPGLLGVGIETKLVGASGCVFGVLVGAAIIAPKQTVHLIFPPIPMQIRTMAKIFLGIAVFSVVVGSANDGGEAGHLGGAAIGFLLMKAPVLLHWAKPRGTRTKPTFAERRSDRKAQREAERQAAMEREVDRILSKVKEDGMHSLTEKEKRTLQRATAEQQKRAG